jgi:hypothetical protein
MKGASMKKQTYPKTIYAVWDGEDDERYLLADASYTGHARTDEDVEVAVYQLVRVAKAKNKTVLT